MKIKIPKHITHIKIQLYAKTTELMYPFEKMIVKNILIGVGKKKKIELIVSK